MKTITSLLIVLSLTVMSFKPSEKIPFEKLFQMAYEQSFSGLENFKDASGKWVFENAMQDFEVYEVKFDMEQGLHSMYFIKKLESASTAFQMMTRYQIQLERLLPKGYEQNYQLQSKGKAIYEYKNGTESDKTKYPTVQIRVEERKDESQMIIQLIEPSNTSSKATKK